MSALKITKENYSEFVERSEEPVLLDFWAPWCGPCRMVAPVIDEIADEVSHAKVGKINIMEEPELADQFKILSIPTLSILKNGKVEKSTVGIQPKGEILKMLNA